MKVQLLTYTPNPELVVANSARLCYSSIGIDELIDKYTDEQNGKLIDKLAKMGHFSPFEHVSFTFGIEGVSRSLTHQLVRHRIASYSQQSQRYVAMKDSSFVMPSPISKNKYISQLYAKGIAECNKYYKDLSISILAVKLITEADVKEIDNVITHLTYTNKSRAQIINSIIEEPLSNLASKYSLKYKELYPKSYNKFSKEALENARYILPNACTSKIIVTMNARELMNFFKHRCCNRAQDEIRVLAWTMLKELKQVAPNIFKYAGPTCYTKGVCSEGSMSCGKPYTKL